MQPNRNSQLTGYILGLKGRNVKAQGKALC